MLHFTIIKSLKPKVLTKTYTRASSSGELIKKTNGHLIRGQATCESVEDITAFADLVTSLRASQALIYGRMNRGLEMAPVLTRDEFAELSDEEKTRAVTRTKDHFDWSEEAGIWQVDIDVRADGTVLQPDDFLTLLDEHLPEAAGVPRMLLPSASSHIHDTATGEDLTGLRGYRLYMPIDNCSLIPGVARTFDLRLKAAGHGYIAISKNGHMRTKSPIDLAVYTPCHLDFASGADCGPGLEQRRGAPRLINADGPALPAASVVLSTETEAAAEAAITALRAEREPEAQRIAADWRRARVAELTAAGTDPASASRIVSHADRGELVGDFVIEVMNPQTKRLEPQTVSALLADPKWFDGWLTRDPLEPDYDGDRLVGKLLLSARPPRLKSHAHGGTDYILRPEAGGVASEYSAILIAEGGTAAAVDKTIAALASTGRFFNTGTELVELRGSKKTILDTHACAYRVGSLIRYSREVRIKGAIQVQASDPTPALVQQLLAHPGRELPDLVGCVDHPVLRHDGTLIAEPGYDPSTRLYVTHGLDAYAGFVSSPDPAQIARAIATCLEPFSRYALGPMGLTAVLAAVLTAVARPGLDLSPMIVVRNPDIGGGKTLLNTALAVIATGHRKSVQTMPESSAEMRKRLLALLIASTEVIIFDNADGALNSDTLASFLTSPLWSDRQLGKSSMQMDLPARCLVLSNGCNMRIGSGLARRVIPIDVIGSDRGRILRSFPFCPVEKALETRNDIVSAALTLMAAVPESFAPTERVNSFLSWDRIVRRTVAWLAQYDARLDDPIRLFAAEIAADADLDGKRGLLEFMCEITSAANAPEFTASDLVRLVDLAGRERELLEHLNSVSGSRPRMSSRSVGTILGSLRDQDVHGMCLRGYSSKGRTIWSIEDQDAPEPMHDPI